MYDCVMRLNYRDRADVINTILHTIDKNWDRNVGCAAAQGWLNKASCLACHRMLALQDKNLGPDRVSHVVKRESRKGCSSGGDPFLLRAVAIHRLTVTTSLLP